VPNGRTALVVIVCLLTAACGQMRHEVTPVAAPFTTSGSVFLLDAGKGAQGSPCQGLRSKGFGDLSSDTRITVTDGPGNVVRALLHQGSFVPAPEGIELTPGATPVCAFPFIINDIAGGQPPYSFTVAHRGSVHFTRAEAESLELVIDRRGVARLADFS
jgi:hypothetical protein